MNGIGNRTKVHQNKYAFAHNPNSKKSARIMAIPNVGLCQRCHDIIEWRKKFRKYKPIKNPLKCGACAQKTVRSAYHHWCTDCAKAANCCPKCLQQREVLGAPVAALTQDAIQDMMVSVGMKERLRRRVWRLWEQDKATDAEIKDMIMNADPDAPEPKDEEEDDVAAAPAASAAAAALGPAPKPAAAAAAKPVPKHPGSDDEDDEDDEDYLDESDGDAEEEAKILRQQQARQAELAAKRGPPPKPKQSKPAAPAVAALEEGVAAAKISDSAVP